MAPQSIGRYRILRELGRGLAATVYLARDPVSARQVAVKVFSPAYTAAPDFAARFEQTLAALTRLEHPFLVTPHDQGNDADQYFIVTRYLPGGTLADRLDGRPMLLAEVVPILQRLAEALDAGHAAHVLHGDLHPADVLFDLHERAFLADLGLAQLLSPAPGPSPVGTPAYTSPEQIAGQPIDGRADVYALGLLLFEMLTGRQPFAGATPQDVLGQHLEQPVPQLSSAALAHLVLPLEFNLVMARALAKNRDYRYPTAGVLVEAVRTMFLMAPADAAPEAAPVEPPRPAAAPTPPLAATRPEPASQPPGAPPTPEPEAGPAATAPDGIEPEPMAIAASAAASLEAGEATQATPDTTETPAEPAYPPPTAPAPPAAEATEATEPLATALMPEMAVRDAGGVPPELVRPAEPRPRRGPAPGTLLLGLAGIGLVLGFVLLARSPGIRAILIAPTATPTATATPLPSSTPSATLTLTPSATATNTPTETASPTATATLTATASPTTAPTVTATATATPTRRPTLPPFTATSPGAATQPAAATPASGTLGAPTQAHLGPPPTGAPG